LHSGAFVLEVLGGAGALWGLSEILGPSGYSCRLGWGDMFFGQESFDFWRKWCLLLFVLCSGRWACMWGARNQSISAVLADGTQSNDGFKDYGAVQPETILNRHLRINLEQQWVLSHKDIHLAKKARVVCVVGDIMRVTETLNTGNIDGCMPLQPGAVGEVVSVDADGNAYLDFVGRAGFDWVPSSDTSSLEVIAFDAAQGIRKVMAKHQEGESITQGIIAEQLMMSG